MKAAYYKPHVLIRPLVAGVIITAAKEEVKKSSEELCTGRRRTGWMAGHPM